MKVSVFVGTSLDGFIARANGDLDFLPPGGGEPHGYDEFMATVDALVMGRKSFEKVLTFDTWPYGEKPVYVLSAHPLAPAPAEAVVERLSGPPAEQGHFQVPVRYLRHQEWTRDRHHDAGGRWQKPELPQQMFGDVR